MDRPDLKNLSIKPVVSVIVPTYNYAKYIGETLRSIQAQTYTNWECIVVDDGSTDNTKDVLNYYITNDHRIKYIYQENQHQAAAKNTGIKYSIGKYIQFLDADDLIECRKLEYQVDFLEQHPEVDITYSSCKYFPTEEPHARWYFMSSDASPWMPEISGSGSEIAATSIENNIMTINSPLIKRTVIEDVGTFDEALKLVEDWDYWIRCALKGKYLQYENGELTLALVRVHSSSSSRNRWQVNESTLLMRNKLNTLIDDPGILSLNKQLQNELQTWMQKIQLVIEDLERLIGRDKRFILVDEDQIRMELTNFTTIPFTENRGQYFGMPSNDEVAIDEFNRQKELGAEFIVFAWTAFWTMNFYKGFFELIQSTSTCICKNERMIVFNLLMHSSENNH